MADVIFNIIIVSIFVIIIIMLFLWVTTIQKVPNSNLPAIQFVPSSYGMRCVTNNTGTGGTNIGSYTSSNPLDYTPQVCDTGLICIKVNENDSTGFCKKLEGQSCTSVYECEPNMKLCAAGICAATVTGGLNQAPPCLSNLIEENGVCKAGIGGKCNTTNDCVDNTVYQCVTNDLSNPNSKTCILPYENGANCIADSDCASNNCDTSNAIDNNGIGTCQPSGDNTGGLGATCLYFQANNQDTACQTNLECNLTDFNNNKGTCLNPVYTWPNNNFLPECISNSCIAPSICNNSVCEFPEPDPLSCQMGVSSGYCLLNYNCISNRCTPNSGYPGIGTIWRMVQWIRSINNEMGYWNPLQYLVTPGAKPSLTSYDNSKGTDFIYAPDVSIHTNLSYTYYYITNQTINRLLINFIFPSDWTTTAIVIPYNIHYTTSNDTGYVALLVNINTGGRSINYVLIGNIIDNTLTCTLPTYTNLSSQISLTNLMPAGIPYNFSIDLRTLTRVAVVFSNQQAYLASNGNSLDPIPIVSASSGSIFTSFGFAVKDMNFYYLEGVTPQLTYVTYSTNNDIVLFPTSQTYGLPNMLNMNTSSRISNNSNIEIFFTNSSTRNSLYYAYGSFWGILPIDINSNSIPLISVLSPELSALGRFPNLYIFTTVV